MHRPILLVEDNGAVRSWMEDALRDAFGRQVLVEASGDRALELVRSQRFGIVITDMQHPGADGIAFCEELRDAARAPVLVASAGCVFSSLTGALDAEGFDWLAKPFGSRELVEKVSEIVGANARREVIPA